MKERHKNLIIHATLGILGAISTVAGYKIGYNSGTKEATKDAPHMVSFNDSQITYEDNLAAGMRAYVVRPSTTNLLSLEEKKSNNDSITFSLPENLRMYEDFCVFAIDQNRNLSKPSYFSVNDNKINEVKNE